MRRRSSLSRIGRTRPFSKFRNGVFNLISYRHGRQLERHHEGHATGRMRGRGRLFTQLLRISLFRPFIFRGFRINGAICFGERGGGRFNETFGRIA